jgi:hypothetical protein
MYVKQVLFGVGYRQERGGRKKKVAEEIWSSYSLHWCENRSMKHVIIVPRRGREDD